MNNIEAIIFDCFGVLYTDAHEATYGTRFPELADELRNLSSASDHGFISRQEYLEGMSKLTGDSLEVIDNAHVHEHEANKPLIEYIRQELKPHYKIGMLSNIGRDFMQNFFDEHELHDLFDAVVLSSGVGYTKPEPEIYHITLDRLGVATRAAVMVDDREVNCHGAEAVGMKSVHYLSYVQAVADIKELLASSKV